MNKCASEVKVGDIITLNNHHYSVISKYIQGDKCLFDLNVFGVHRAYKCSLDSSVYVSGNISPKGDKCRMRYVDRKCTYVELLTPHRYVFTGPCIQCGQEVRVSIPAESLYKYRQGQYIQVAMSELTADEREFLLTGICPVCWNKLFPEE